MGSEAADLSNPEELVLPWLLTCPLCPTSSDESTSHKCCSRPAELQSKAALRGDAKGVAGGGARSAAGCVAATLFSLLVARCAVALTSRGRRQLGGSEGSDDEFL